MATTFEASEGEPLPERLVRALEAGQAVGGDKRGKQSAAVTTVKDQPYPYIDMRVDEHPDPVVELRRIYEVVKVQMLPFIEALPTRRNPKGDFGEEIRGALIPEVSFATLAPQTARNLYHFLYLFRSQTTSAPATKPAATGAAALIRLRTAS